MTHRLDIGTIAKRLGLGALLGISVLAVAGPASAQQRYYGRDYYGNTYTTRDWRMNRNHNRHNRHSRRYRAIRRLKDDYDNDGWSNVNDRFPYDPYRH